MTKKYIDINTGREYNKIPLNKVQPVFVNNQPVTLEAYDEYYKSNPIELKEVTVTPNVSIDPKDTDLNLKHRDKVKLSDALVMETSAFEKPLNFLSPSLYVGAIFLKEKPFWKSIYDGNSGLVSDLFAKKYPNLAVILNMLGDSAIGLGINRFYRYTNTPKFVGSGANKEAYTYPFSYPFSRKVYFRNVADSEYIKEQNALPGSVKYTLEKYDVDGNPIFSSPKLKMIKKPDYKFIKNAFLHHYFPVIEDTETIFVNPLSLKVMLDLEWGKNLFGKVYAVDPEVLSYLDYLTLLKRGGKLNANIR